MNSEVGMRNAEGGKELAEGRAWVSGVRFQVSAIIGQITEDGIWNCEGGKWKWE